MYEFSNTKGEFKTKLTYPLYQIAMLLLYTDALEEINLVIKATCPECKNETEVVSPPELGQRLTCMICNTPLEIVWLYPISLDYVEMEDWQKNTKPVGSNGV